MYRYIRITAMYCWLGAAGCFFAPEGSAVDESRTTSGDDAHTGGTSGPDMGASASPTTGESCTNGVEDASEPCDDGNRVDADACTNACAVAACGDGIVWIGHEECDDGLDNGPGKACSGACVANVCGDGALGEGEMCDDGNADVSDWCPNCQLAICGDGWVWTGQESCDDGNTVETDACNNACEPATCGDGVVWTGQESCDDANRSDTDECTNACELATCGDGAVWADQETCDDGNDIDTDSCTSACLPAVCGDGILYEGVEQCDDGNDVGGDGCSSTCKLCGNDLAEAGETCDGTDLKGKECTDFPSNYGGGDLMCSAGCLTYDFSKCCRLAGQSCNNGSQCCSGSCVLFSCGA
jgi:cysteine-rich repeat protein